MAKIKRKLHFHFIRKNLLPIFLVLVLVALTLITYQVTFRDKYYPFTFVGDTNISFLTKGQAIRQVESNFQKRSRQKLQFYLNQDSFTIDLATASASLDYAALDEGFKNSHNSFIFFLNLKIDPEITLNLDKQLDNISSITGKAPLNAELIFDERPNLESTSSSRIQIKESIDGLSLDRDKIQKLAEDYLLSGTYLNSIPLKIVSPKVTTQHIMKAKLALEKLIDEPVKLTFDNQTWTIDIKTVLALLDLQTGQDVFLDKDRTYVFLEKIALEIDQPVQEGLFEFNPQTKRVIAFQPSKEGRKLDKDKAYQLITEVLINPTDGQKIITLPVDISKPKIETADVNSLGIKELLGRGISRFTGSIPNRIYNINLTASKINGILLPPGEIFSFNRTIGDITAATGFKQAYVIKEGRTVLDDGGGVCQDSTTLFRAVLNAGLPVVKRTAHAYRVGYYEQGFPPGLDATVFYPSVDFQFKNDTSNHILIQAYTSGATLYVDLYGTSDGRTVTLTKPIILNQTPPPPDLRQDDPTLPKGTVKQVDWSAWGANVSFKRTVYKQGETILNETWKSNYKPWQAVYLVGTGD